MEAGGPYLYANGGVWPQGIIWYAMGLLSAKQPDVAKDVIKKYLTLDGIRNSPNGQPSFFEFRNADAQSLKYGQIDKPTFLWAAGWYLYALYHLCGIRENEWNVSFDPNLPDGFENIEYDLMINGKRCRVFWNGKGNYLQHITVDGKKSNSAVIFSTPEKIILERGIPESPYLAYASCIVNNIEYRILSNALQIDAQGVRGQSIELKVVSPLSPKKVLVNGIDQTNSMSVVKDETLSIVNFQSILDEPTATVVFQF